MEKASSYPGSKRVGQGNIIPSTMRGVAFIKLRTEYSLELLAQQKFKKRCFSAQQKVPHKVRRLPAGLYPARLIRACQQH